jgi:hypothetical protein
MKKEELEQLQKNAEVVENRWKETMRCTSYTTISETQSHTFSLA